MYRELLINLVGDYVHWLCAFVMCVAGYVQLGYVPGAMWRALCIGYLRRFICAGVMCRRYVHAELIMS